MDSPSPSEIETLNEFVVVTGVSLDEDDTMTKARALLAHHNFNLNNSVLAFFEQGFDLPEPAAPRDIEPQFAAEDAFASGAERFEGGNFRNLQGDFFIGDVLPRLAKAPRISNKWQLDLGIHVSRKAFRTEGEKQERIAEEKPRKLSFLWIILLIVPKTLSLIYSTIRYLLGLNFNTSLYQVPRVKFDFEAFDEDYDPQSLLSQESISSFNISHDKFNECHGSSQSDFHFLLVVLCDDKSSGFVEKLLQSPPIKTLLSKQSGEYKDTQIFINNVDKSPEAFEVASKYNRRRLPYVFLIGNVTRDPSVMSSMSIVYKANCGLGDDEEQNVLIRKMAKNLGRTMADYNPQLVTKRYDKQEIEMSRLIKEKQDEAYLESLHSDKVKKVEKENQRIEQELQTQKLNSKKSFINHLVATKYFETQTEGLSASDFIRISIKLPDGRRIVHKFPKTSAIGEIYLFVETQLDRGDGGEESSDLTITDFLEQFGFAFELFKPLPKCCLPSSNMTIAEFESLKSGDSVLFEYIDDEDE